MDISCETKVYHDDEEVHDIMRVWYNCNDECRTEDMVLPLAFLPFPL